MPATRKIRKLQKAKSGEDRETLTLPGPDDLLVPPANFLQYTTLIFGEKGVGKTSLAAQFENAVVFQWEPRRRNLKIRQVPQESEPALTWSRFTQYVDLACDDPTVEVVVWDTVDRAYDACLEARCAKLGIDNPSEMKDYGATWNSIKAEFERVYLQLCAAGKASIFISHAQLRDIESRDGETYNICVPTCKPACFGVLKAICDYGFYYGYHQGARALFLRGNNLIWSATGTDNFLDPEGKPVEILHVGETPSAAYRTLLKSFANKVYDATHQEKDEIPKLKKKAAKSE